MGCRIEEHNLHGCGSEPCEVYDVEPAEYGGGPDYWGAVTDIPCPVDGCSGTVVWYEAGYVPGYRVCMPAIPGRPGCFDAEAIRHRFLAGGNAASPCLIRDTEAE